MISTKKPLSTTQPKADKPKSSKPASTKAPLPSSLSGVDPLEFSFQRKVFTNLKSFSSCHIAHITNKSQLVVTAGSLMSLYELKSFQPISTIKIENFEINELCYLNHVGLIMGICWKSREIRFWTPIFGKLKYHSKKKFDWNPVSSCVFSKIDIVCTASLTRHLCFWSGRSQRNYFQVSVPNGFEIRALASIEKKSSIVIGCKDGSIILFNYLSRSMVKKYQLPFTLIIILDLYRPFIAYNSLMDLLFLGSANGNIEVLRFKEKDEKEIVVRIKSGMSQTGVRGIQMLENDKYFMTIHDSPFIQVWNAEKFQFVKSVPAKINQAYSYSVDPKLRQIVVSELQGNLFSVLNFICKLP